MMLTHDPEECRKNLMESVGQLFLRTSTAQSWVISLIGFCLVLFGGTLYRMHLGAVTAQAQETTQTLKIEDLETRVAKWESVPADMNAIRARDSVMCRLVQELYDSSKAKSRRM